MYVLVYRLFRKNCSNSLCFTAIIVSSFYFQNYFVIIVKYFLFEFFLKSKKTTIAPYVLLGKTNTSIINSIVPNMVCQQLFEVSLYTICVFFAFLSANDIDRASTIYNFFFSNIETTKIWYDVDNVYSRWHVFFCDHNEHI